jgi:hypothetical protein
MLTEQDKAFLREKYKALTEEYKIIPVLMQPSSIFAAMIVAIIFLLWWMIGSDSSGSFTCDSPQVKNWLIDKAAVDRGWGIPPLDRKTISLRAIREEDSDGNRRICSADYEYGKVSLEHVFGGLNFDGPPPCFKRVKYMLQKTTDGQLYITARCQ